MNIYNQEIINKFFSVKILENNKDLWKIYTQPFRTEIFLNFKLNELF